MTMHDDAEFHHQEGARQRSYDFAVDVLHDLVAAGWVDPEEAARLRAERDEAINTLDAARLRRTRRPGEPCPGCGRTDFAHDQRCPDLAAGITAHSLSLVRFDLRRIAAEHDAAVTEWAAFAADEANKLIAMTAQRDALLPVLEAAKAWTTTTS